MNKKCKSCGEQLDGRCEYINSIVGGTPHFNQPSKHLSWDAVQTLNVEDADLCELCCVDLHQRLCASWMSKLLRARDARLAAMREG